MPLAVAGYTRVRMKLVFLYGPPAVGKLTVARELEKRTGFKLFDNHVSINAVLPYFEFGTPPFGRIVGSLRRMVIEEAVKAGLDLIFTVVYVSPGDNMELADLVAVVELNGGEVCFVRLHCAEAELKNRVATEARAARHKVASVEVLEDLLERHDLFSEVPGRASLTVDTTVPPEQVAERIIGHYDLPRRQTA